MFTLGAGVTEFSVGERVLVVPGFPLNEEEYDVSPLNTAPSFTLPGFGIWGAYAQFMEVPARWILKDETGLEPAQLATLPVVLATSVRATKKIAEVRAGDKVLIHSGGSGSGSMQMQVAKALEAQVATTVRDDAKGARASALGAELVINTRREDFVELVKEWTEGRGADAVIDNLGGDVLSKSIDAVKSLGIVVAYGFAAGTEVSFDVRRLFFEQKQLRGSMASDLQDLKWGLEQVRTGRIEPVLDRSLPLSEAAEAHRLIAANAVAGKVVLLPWAT